MFDPMWQYQFAGANDYLPLRNDFPNGLPS
jgi:hypothetical protein